ncbi:MAG: hypothetical protein ACPHID_03900 [Thermoplasmatota archaeon]
MANPVFLAASVTIVPAVAALWYLLKRYEDYFEDARVFLALVFGFFGGMFAIFMELAAFAVDPWTGIAALLFVVAGYAFFETGTKVIVLGSKKFRNRKDTPYYGAALGLGFGAMMALGIVAVNLNAVEANAAFYNRTVEQLSYGPQSFLAMALVPLGMMFVHGAAGIHIGNAVARGKLVQGWGVGALIQAPALFAFAMVYPSIGLGDAVTGRQWFFAVTTPLYGLWMMHSARVNVLDTIVPQHIKDQIRRDKRRQLRKD